MAGYIRFAAFVLIAGILAAACSGAASPEPSSTTTPPPPTATQAPTATLPPELEATSVVDTSAWPIFSSPLGFDIKYPPGWTVDDSASTDFPFQRVRIRNELSQREQDARSEEAPRGFVPLSGEAWLDISPDPFPTFAKDDFFRSCGSEEDRETGASRATETFVDGHRAVRCIGTGLTLGGTEQVDATVFWIEQPPGRSVRVGYTVIGGDQDIIAVADAALATVHFRTEPIDTSAWPTYESESLAFSMRYPPTWMVDGEDLFPPNVSFLNEVAQASLVRQEPDGTRDFSSDEDAGWIEIGTWLFMRIGLDAFIENCSETPIDTTFASQPATKCGDQYWVELPSGGPILVGGYTNEAGPRTHQLIDAALATITFHE